MSTKKKPEELEGTTDAPQPAEGAEEVEGATDAPQPIVEQRYTVASDALGLHRRGDVVTAADFPGGGARVAELVARGALVEA